MFSESGQPLHSQVARGGGKGGGGGASAPAAPPAPIVLTDPVNGKSFVDTSSMSATGGRTGYMPMPGGGYAFIPADQGGGKSAQDQLNEEIAQRQAGEQATSDQAKADAAAKAAGAETDFQGRRQSAYDTAMQSIMQQFRGQGADPSAYMNEYINPALQRQYQSIQDLDPNPTAAFSPDLGQSIECVE